MQQATVDDARLRFFIGDVRDRDRLTRALQGRRRRRPRGRAEAGPGVRVQPVRGGADQRPRRAERRRRGDRRAACRRSIALSTDKAVQPGQPLRRDEAVRREALRAGQRLRRRRATRASSCVRYGNVVGSRGSRGPVLPRAAPRPATLTITDERMTRFWITLDAGRRLRARTRSSTWTAARSSSRRSRRCSVVDLAEAIAPGVRTRDRSASGPARSCTR